jgi:Carboxymuconolactone decarboxylase family
VIRTAGGPLRNRVRAFAAVTFLVTGRRMGLPGRRRRDRMGPLRLLEVPMGALKEFAGVYYREGALDPKTTQLVALAAMAAAGCTS